MRVGISITTHNRPHVLAYTLMHFKRFEPWNDAMIVISDDNSSEENNLLNIRAIQELSPFKVMYLHSEKRLGIAKNKNTGIRELRRVGCDHYFLFDDDCMPIGQQWDMPFIELAARGCEHSMHLVDAGPDVCILEELPDRTIWNNAGGYCLYASKRCMDALEGFDERYGIYGFEHADFTRRAAKAGFCGEHQYVSPIDSGQWIYSLDMDLGWKQKESPLGPMPGTFHSSVAAELDKVAGWVEENRKIYVQG